MEPRTLTYYDFHEMNFEVDKALGLNSRDCGQYFFPDTTEFSDWFKSKNYSEVDSDGKKPHSSRIWFAEYQAAIKSGEITEVPYCDFWHWQIEHCFYDNVHNPCYLNVYIGLDFKEKDVEIKPWQLIIQTKWNELFKQYADEDDYVFVCIEW